MSFSRDLYTNDLAATLAAARGFTAAFDELSCQHKLLRAAGVFGSDEPRNAFEFAVRGLDPMSERMRAVSALSAAHAALSRSVGLFARDSYPSAFVEQARRLSETAQNFALPEVLEVFRTPTEFFAERILRLSRPEFGLSPDFLESTSALAAFGRASAMADMFAESERLTRDVRLAVGQFSITDMPRFDDLAGYRSFLDATGLGLSRWPRRRHAEHGRETPPHCILDRDLGGGTCRNVSPPVAIKRCFGWSFCAQSKVCRRLAEWCVSQEKAGRPALLIIVVIQRCLIVFLSAIALAATVLFWL